MCFVAQFSQFSPNNSMNSIGLWLLSVAVCAVLLCSFRFCLRFIAVFLEKPEEIRRESFSEIGSGAYATPPAGEGGGWRQSRIGCSKTSRLACCTYSGINPVGRRARPALQV